MRVRKRWLFVAGLILAIAYLAWGFYFVRPDELAVVRWLGRAPEAYRRVPPGIHYALPWPICRVDQPKTAKVRRIFVGQIPEQREAIARGEGEAMRASPPSDMFTGDVNILKVTMAVQYQVSDPAQYLFGAADPDALVADTVQAVLIEELAGVPVDEALTVGKAELETQTRSQAQRLLDRCGCGVRLVATNLESIEPPWAILAAFQDVVSAKKDGEKSVDQAVTESNRILPRARGEAAAAGQEAEAYRYERVSRARGEAARFLSVMAEYRRDPEVFKQRLLLQTLEKVIPRIRAYVLDSQPGDPPTSVRIIE